MFAVHGSILCSLSRENGKEWEDMAKNRYKNTGQNRQFTGKLKVMEAVNRKLYRVELWALNDKPNRNNWQYVNLERHLGEFRDVPILTAYTKGGRQIGDGHNYEMKRDPKTGEEYASFTGPDAERIVGWVPKDANIRIEQDGEETSWIVVTGYLWRWYARELVEKIARQGDGLEISIETLVTKEHINGNIEVEEEYIVLGITVLGDGEMPAVAGANIQTLAAIRSSMEKECFKAASYMTERDEEGPGKTTEGVRMNMQATKHQLEALTAKFNGFICVGASGDMQVMALADEGMNPFIYAAEDSDEGNIIQERIRQATATVTYRADGAEVSALLEDVMAPVLATQRLMEQEATTAGETIKALSEQIEAMKKRENARRLQAARDAVEAEIEYRNENRAEDMRFSTEMCRELMADIEKGKFTGMENERGEWTGEEAVRLAVRGLCMDEQTKMDAKARAQEKRVHHWSLNNSVGGGEPQTLGEKMALNIQTN